MTVKDNKLLTWLLSFTILIFIFSCKNEVIEPKIEVVSYEILEPFTFKSSNELKPVGIDRQKEAILDLQNIMQELLISDTLITRELYELGKVDYYADYYIGLSDLLFPEKSGLYEVANLSPRISGQFKMAFEEKLRQGNYINLKAYIKEISNPIQYVGKFPSGESRDIYIYCPYCLDNGEEQLTTPTIVPTTEDQANALPGNKIFEDGIIKGVVVNDDFAYDNLTFNITSNTLLDVYPITPIDPIYGGGSSPSRGIQDESDLVPGVNYPSVYDNWSFICNSKLLKVVNVGDMTLHKKQYDPYFGFINSGGSEMVVMRIDGYLQIAENGNVKADNKDIETSFEKKYKRRWIRKEIRKTWAALWDQNWECDNTEQLFVIYEEDNNATKEFNSKITTKFKIFGQEVNAEATYKTSVPTEDDIIRLWRINNNAFFRSNSSNLGCDTHRHHWLDNNYYTIYDCGTNVEFTLPSYYIN